MQEEYIVKKLIVLLHSHKIIEDRVELKPRPHLEVPVPEVALR